MPCSVMFDSSFPLSKQIAPVLPRALAKVHLADLDLDACSRSVQSTHHAKVSAPKPAHVGMCAGKADSWTYMRYVERGSVHTLTLLASLRVAAGVQLRGWGIGAVDALDLSNRNLDAIEGSFIARLVRDNTVLTMLDLSKNPELAYPAKPAKHGAAGVSDTDSDTEVRPKSSGKQRRGGAGVGHGTDGSQGQPVSSSESSHPASALLGKEGAWPHICDMLRHNQCLRFLWLRRTDASVSHSIAAALARALRSNTTLDTLVLRRAPLPIQAIRGNVSARQLELWSLAEAHAAKAYSRSRDSDADSGGGMDSSSLRFEARRLRRWRGEQLSALNGPPRPQPPRPHPLASVEEDVVGNLLPINTVATRVNGVAVRGTVLALAYAVLRPYVRRVGVAGGVSEW